MDGRRSVDVRGAEKVQAVEAPLRRQEGPRCGAPLGPVQCWADAHSPAAPHTHGNRGQRGCASSGYTGGCLIAVAAFPPASTLRAGSGGGASATALATALSCCLSRLRCGGGAGPSSSAGSGFVAERKATARRSAQRAAPRTAAASGALGRLGLHLHPFRKLRRRVRLARNLADLRYGVPGTLLSMAMEDTLGTRSASQKRGPGDDGSNSSSSAG